MLVTEPEDDEDALHGEDSETDSEDDVSAPAAGNTEGDGVQMSKQEAREARGQSGQFRHCCFPNL